VIAHEDDPRYRAVLERLHGRGRFGIRLGLSRIRALLRSLGNPERGLPGVLIGGTNGKGSVQALVAAALEAGGYRTGQMPSPHLASYRERIAVGGQPIGVEDFTTLLEEVLDAAETIAPRHGPATEFEVLTAAAFLWFKRAGVQVGVVEVGMGGRLDATNAWQGGVSAITNVALDHMEYLGSTIEAIAREKAQIIKRGDQAAITGAEERALAVIARRAARVDVPLRIVEPLPVLAMDRRGVHVRLPDETELTVGLLGRHQAANAAVAIAVLDAFAAAGTATVSRPQLSTAFAAAHWPGRLELITRAGQPDVLLDGAHNPHGVAALGAALEELLPQLSQGRPTLLVGVMANHWQPGMLDPLRDAAPDAQVIATRVPDTANPLDPRVLADAWGTGAVSIADPSAALAAALAAARQAGGPLVGCGSLYLVGYLRGLLAGEA
jgi:dihydrofolate synthase/folylpolyglutamate synthase